MSDSDGGAGEENERKTEVEVVGPMYNIRNDLSERELSGEDAQERSKWRRLIRHIDPHIKVGKDVDEEE